MKADARLAPYLWLRRALLVSLADPNVTPPLYALPNYASRRGSPDGYVRRPRGLASERNLGGIAALNQAQTDLTRFGSLSSSRSARES